MKKNITIGMDLGDKNHSICVMQDADKIVECAVTNTAIAVEKFFKKSKGLSSKSYLDCAPVAISVPFIVRCMLRVEC